MNTKLRDRLSDSSKPAVSIILPTYNRAKFLPQAFESIRSQTFTDWELIVADDGSTDDTSAVVAELSRAGKQRVQYNYAKNGGPAVARNRGVDLANGKYIAFFDSDDLWLPHHLQDCALALDTNPDVDWVYGSCQLVDLETSHELQPSSFYPGGSPRAFLNLKNRIAGRLQIIVDPNAACCMISNGLMCGLQCSVMRRTVLQTVRIPEYRIAEDQIFVVQVLKAGFTLGYFDAVHTVYRVHDECSSARVGGGVDKAIASLRELARAYESLPTQVRLSPPEQTSLHRRLGREWFWTLGYSLLWQSGRRAEAIHAFKRGLYHWPWDWRCWKTYFAARLRCLLATKGVEQC